MSKCNWIIELWVEFDEGRWKERERPRMMIAMVSINEMANGRDFHDLKSKLGSVNENMRIEMMAMYIRMSIGRILVFFNSR